MNGSFDGLRADIRRELRDLQRVLEQTKQVLAHEEWPDLAFSRTLGSLLHDFYTGVEKIFQRITLEMEGSLPAGPDWHIQLLRRMSTPIDQVRPAVLDEEFVQRLGEYLRFRHVFRVVYGFELSRARLQELAVNLDEVFASLDAQIGGFIEFLETIDRSTEDP